MIAAAGAAGGSVLAEAFPSPASAATTVEQGAVAPAVVDLTDAATIAVDASLGNDFRLTLGGNHTMGNPSYPADGQQIVFQITQGAGGSQTLAWGTNYAFSSGLPQPTLSTGAGQTDLLTFIYNANLGKWLLSAFVNDLNTPPVPQSRTYRLFPSTDGPHSAISYAGNWTSSVKFIVTENARWLEGYWWWVCPTGGLTAPQKFYLLGWLGIGGNAATVVVPGSAVTSGRLAAGWNYIPLSEPIPLAVGEPYNSRDGGSTLYSASTDVNGNFPDTAGYWNNGQPGGSGITNGPLTAFSSQSGSLAAPYEQSQGMGNGDNAWIDIQVSDTGPSGYGGPYRIWPNKYDANFGVGGDAPSNYVIAVEVHLSVACDLSAIWYYSPAGTSQLATECDIWDIGTQSKVAGDSSPTWEYPLGGAASPASGWVRCDFTGVTLPAGGYRVSVYNGAANPDEWSAKDAYYFASATGYTGPGCTGLTFGPVYAPGLSAASDAYVYDANGGSNSPPYSNDNGNKEPGQSTFAVGPPNQYPNLYVDGLAQNYWIDIEVTPAAQ